LIQLTLQVDPGLVGHVDVSGFGSDDSLAFSASAQGLLSISSLGNDVILVTNAAQVINRVVLKGTVQSGQLIHDVASFNALAVGDLRFVDTYQPQSSSLDSLGGTLATPASLNAAAASLNFQDAIGSTSNTRISNFGADDSLRFTDGTGAQLSIASQGGDVMFTVNNDGVISSVTLVGVATSNQIIHNIASFNALPVGDVFI